MPVKKGDTIKVHYTGSFEDGKVFDSSEGREPLEFKAGEGMVVKGFDDAVIGMEKGEEKEVDINPEEGYGQSNPELQQKVPKDKFPPEMGDKLQPGAMIMLQGPDGNQIPAHIKEVGDSEVTIDLNHPLAGKKLHFKVKIEEIA